MNGKTLANLHTVAFVCTWAFAWLVEHRLLIKCLHPSPSVLGHLDPGMPWQSSCLHLPFRAANYHQPNADKFWMWPVNLSALLDTLAGHQTHSEVLLFWKIYLVGKILNILGRCWRLWQCSFFTQSSYGLHVKAGLLIPCCWGCHSVVRLTLFKHHIMYSFLIICSISAFIGCGNPLLWISFPSWINWSHYFTSVLCEKWFSLCITSMWVFSPWF